MWEIMDRLIPISKGSIKMGLRQIGCGNASYLRIECSCGDPNEPSGSTTRKNFMNS
jgi:hypothetical protein